MGQTFLFKHAVIEMYCKGPIRVSNNKKVCKGQFNDYILSQSLTESSNEGWTVSGTNHIKCSELQCHVLSLS